MKTLSIDIETYSDQNLAKTGVYRYVESPVFEILLFSYSVDGDPVQLVDLACGEEIVYICSPYAGDVEKNVAAAQGYSRFAVDKGYIPIAPHLLFPQFLNDSNPKERQLGLFFGNALMSKCSEVWVFGDTISDGMEAEIKRAKWKNYRLRYFTETCEEVKK